MLAGKRQTLMIVLCGLLATTLLIGGLLVWHRQNGCQLQLEQSCLSLEYATTPAQAAKGLGDRNTMPDDHGMLFVLKPGTACFWMKDMQFNLDIAWLNADKRVVMIKPNLSPDSYPQKYCAPATYVLETNAEVMAHNHLQVGQQLHF